MNALSYSNYLFSPSLTRASSNNYASILANANYYKTLSTYTTASKYSKHIPTNQHSSTSNISSDCNTKRAASKKTTDFLTQYKDTYNTLKSACNDLRTKLDSTDATDESKVAAVQEYAKAYNSTLDFLDDHSSEHTHVLNVLKKLLANIVQDRDSQTTALGITQDNSGKLSVDTKTLTNALEKNSSSTTNKLSSLLNTTDVYTQMASSTSSTKLIQEQNINTTSSSSSTSSPYSAYIPLVNNPSFMKSYYYNMMSLGSFIDFSI